MQFKTSLSFAKELDKNDPLKDYRKQFYIPKQKGKEVLYFCSNSLGLQPNTVKAAVEHELEQWKNLGVNGHHEGKMPWIDYHKTLSKQTAKIVGAKESEVVVMNSLTVNLHSMLTSFYQPYKKRIKILMEGGAFPSDQYAVTSHIEFKGLKPHKTIIEILPRKGEALLRDEDIISTISAYGSQTALIMFAGVNYLTGQMFDIEKITKEARDRGALVGFDLAHAVGNVPLKLHEWGVDFAIWCGYKYLSSGPGGPGGVYIHERHANNSNLNRLAGWWGHDAGTRFKMPSKFKPMKGAEGWQMSNSQVLSFAAQRAGLDIIAKAGMNNIRKKSLMLTGYLEFLIKELIAKGCKYEIITSSNPEERGAQLSIKVPNKTGKAVFEAMKKKGAIVDWREPNIIRIAPSALYNTFQDVQKLANIMDM